MIKLLTFSIFFCILFIVESEYGDEENQINENQNSNDENENNSNEFQNELNESKHLNNTHMGDDNINKSDIPSCPSNIEFFENHLKVCLNYHTKLIEDVLKKKI